MFVFFFCIDLSFSAAAQDVNQTVYFKVFASEEMNFRAENIPDENKIRSLRSKGRSKGFAEDGNYGVNEVEKLLTKTRKELLSRFNKAEWLVTEDPQSGPSYFLQVMILDAKNNAPTINQMRGLGLEDGQKEGGATLVAKLTLSSDASKTKTFVYSKYSGTRSKMTTWGSANMAIDSFTKKLVKSISDDNLTLDGGTVKL